MSFKSIGVVQNFVNGAISGANGTTMDVARWNLTISGVRGQQPARAPATKPQEQPSVHRLPTRESGSGAAAKVPQPLLWSLLGRNQEWHPPMAVTPAQAPANQPPADQWTPADEGKIRDWVTEALSHHNGDVYAAYVELRNWRQYGGMDGTNYDYDTNLAIAADYLRARWNTQLYGPVVATEMNDAYMALKGTAGVPKEGPGPVSPYSELEWQYMNQGVVDETHKMPFWEGMLWSSPPGVAVGGARSIWGQFGRWFG